MTKKCSVTEMETFMTWPFGKKDQQHSYSTGNRRVKKSVQKESWCKVGELNDKKICALDETEGLYCGTGYDTT